ncbi:hypothetical protein B0T09DRAFT_358262 [Sordaria sp. MPI-SDFR-AT-0083]|nr:hypothetical protein B0T09DRAFT_358262 [Sordaria sp. MPI-SDFR-AT-0083]
MEPISDNSVNSDSFGDAGMIYNIEPIASNHQKETPSEQGLNTHHFLPSVEKNIEAAPSTPERDIPLSTDIVEPTGEEDSDHLPPVDLSSSPFPLTFPSPSTFQHRDASSATASPVRPSSRSPLNVSTSASSQFSSYTSMSEEYLDEEEDSDDYFSDDDDENEKNDEFGSEDEGLPSFAGRYDRWPDFENLEGDEYTCIIVEYPDGMQIVVQSGAKNPLTASPTDHLRAPRSFDKPNSTTPSPDRRKWTRQYLLAVLFLSSNTSRFLTHSLSPTAPRRATPRAPLLLTRLISHRFTHPLFLALEQFFVNFALAKLSFLDCYLHPRGG